MERLVRGAAVGMGKSFFGHDCGSALFRVGKRVLLLGAWRQGGGRLGGSASCAASREGTSSRPLQLFAGDDLTAAGGSRHHCAGGRWAELGRFPQVAFEPFGQPDLFDLASSERSKNNGAFYVVGFQAPAVQIAECFRHQVRSSFVTVDKGMIARNALSVGCSNCATVLCGLKPKRVLARFIADSSTLVSRIPGRPPS
jgi:hypothetical protein